MKTLPRDKQMLTRKPGASVTKKKSFITLAPGDNVIKLFFFVADDEA
jgi:hypothetical protein